MFSNTLKLIKIKNGKKNCKKSKQIFKFKQCYFLSLKCFSICMNCYMDAKPPTHASSNQFLTKCLWIHLKTNYAQPRELQILTNTYNTTFFLLQFKRQQSLNVFRPWTQDKKNIHHELSTMLMDLWIPHQWLSWFWNGLIVLWPLTMPFPH